MGFLGEGSFATVYKLQKRSTGQQFALKIVRPKGEAGNTDVMAEIANLSELQHANIVKVHGYWQEGAAYHIVMDLCTGGNLQNYVTSYITEQALKNPRFGGGLHTRIATRFIGQMLSGVAYLHDEGFIHRDIKPENYMLETLNGAPTLKLVDFGFACKVSRGQKLQRQVGTPTYAAPEVLGGEYDEKADVWSLATTIYVMCTNRMPFPGRDAKEYVQNVIKGDISDPDEAWAHHPKRLRALTLGLLEIMPENRPSAREALSGNEWLQQGYTLGALIQDQVKARLRG